MTEREANERINMLEIQNLHLKSEVSKRDDVLTGIENDVRKFEEKGWLKKLISIAELIFSILKRIWDLKKN
jgi:hypothetical protein